MMNDKLNDGLPSVGMPRKYELIAVWVIGAVALHKDKHCCTGHTIVGRCK